MKIFTFSISALFILSTAVISQVHQDWVQRFNGPGNGNDVANSMVVDASGNIYVTGSTAAAGTGKNIATIKYNPSGVQQWLQIYNGPGNADDEANSITVDGTGNVYVTGSSYGSGGNEDYTTLKYSSSGSQLWVQRYNGPGNNRDVALSIGVDVSGNVYVTGFSTGSGINYDYATIKYNSSGVQQWVQRYNGPSNLFDAAYSLAIDGSMNVYVTGMSSASATDYSCLTIKYNSSGVQQWYRTYGSPAGWDCGNAITVDPSGNVYISGYSTGVGTYHDILLLKYNSSGIQQWAGTYNGTANYNDEARSIAIDGSGNVYAAGLVSASSIVVDYATLKYSSSGVQQWIRTYNGPANIDDYATSIAIDGSGNVYVTGESFVTQTNSDYVTIKYNSAGEQQWLQRYDGPANGYEHPSSIAADGSGNVYVTGRSTSPGSDYDFCTIKYSQQIGIKKISSEIPDKYSLSQNYPNPFNPSTTIEFDIPKTSYTKLIVYDLLGREIGTLVNEELKAGSYSVSFNGDNLSSGVYYYKISAASGANYYSSTKKMLMLK